MIFEELSSNLVLFLISGSIFQVASVAQWYRSRFVIQRSWVQILFLPQKVFFSVIPYFLRVVSSNLTENVKFSAPFSTYVTYTSVLMAMHRATPQKDELRKVEEHGLN